jgi:hypothetical protein
LHREQRRKEKGNEIGQQSHSSHEPEDPVGQAIEKDGQKQGKQTHISHTNCFF